MQWSGNRPMSCVPFIGSVSLMLVILLLGSSAATAESDGPPGITEPTVFAPFDPSAPICTTPPGLERVLAFAQDNEREFMQGVKHGLSLAAKDRKLKSIDFGNERISDGEFLERLQKVQKGLKEEGLTVGLAYATEHMPGDVQYLTGYDPHIENVALLVLPNHLVVVGGAEGEKMFEDMGRAGMWRNLSLFEIPFQDYGGLRFYTLIEILREFLGDVPDEIGLLSAPNVLSQEIVAMAQKADNKQVRLRDVSHIMANARYRKSPAELQLFRTASRIATEAMRAMLSAVAPGTRELEVAAAGDAICKKFGAYGYGFDTMVCSGPRINTIIGRASNRVIQRDDLVMLGVSPRFEGYTSALGRTVVAGGATPEQAAFLDHGIHAHELAIAKLMAGKPAREVDLAARRYLNSVQLAQYHTYGVGHGIGFTECLEGKTATQSSDYDLPVGVAIMIDVGLFWPPCLLWGQT